MDVHSSSEWYKLFYTETILMDLLELSCANCRSAFGRSLIGNSNSLVFWVVCVHSSVEFLGCCVVKAGEEKSASSSYRRTQKHHQVAHWVPDNLVMGSA